MVTLKIVSYQDLSIMTFPDFQKICAIHEMSADYDAVFQMHDTENIGK